MKLEHQSEMISHLITILSISNLLKVISSNILVSQVINQTNLAQNKQIYQQKIMTVSQSPIWTHQKVIMKLMPKVRLPQRL